MRSSPEPEPEPEAEARADPRSDPPIQERPEFREASEIGLEQDVQDIDMKSYHVPRMMCYLNENCYRARLVCVTLT